MVSNTFDRMSERLNKKVKAKEKALAEVESLPPKGKVKTSIEKDTRLQRESLVLPSGKKIKTFLTYVNTSECEVWEGNNRLDETRNDDSLNDLIAAIEAQGQIVPAFVRPAPEKSNYKYEVIYGSRRFAACYKLSEKLLTQVGIVSDKDALIMMDAENNARKELSVYEKALSYQKWLSGGYFKNRSDLASSLGVSVGWVSKTQAILKIPDDVLSAFVKKTDIKVVWAIKLNSLINLGVESKNKLIDRALKKPKTIQDSDSVYKYLIKMEGAAEKGENNKEIVSEEKCTLKDSDGKVICNLELSKDGVVKAIFNKKLEFQAVRETIERAYIKSATWEF
jgi:ParB/RepB/Spo0J family partition protein